MIWNVIETAILMFLIAAMVIIFVKISNQETVSCKDATIGGVFRLAECEDK